MMEEGVVSVTDWAPHYSLLRSIGLHFGFYIFRLSLQMVALSLTTNSIEIHRNFAPIYKINSFVDYVQLGK